jgi:hypothetical protein
VSSSINNSPVLLSLQVMRNHLADVLDFLADVHTLSKVGLE